MHLPPDAGVANLHKTDWVWENCLLQPIEHNFMRWKAN
jgi:hypothetical protein